MLSESWLALSRLRSPTPPVRILSRLHYPLPGTPRVAVLGPAVKTEDQRPLLPSLDLPPASPLQSRKPSPLPCPTSSRSPASARKGFLSLPSLTLPLVVFSSLRTGILSQQDRERLWQAFGLPFYEQIRDDEGRLLAYECDARDGFHWVGEEVGTHLARPVFCACGRMATKTPASAQTESAAQATTGR